MRWMRDAAYQDINRRMGHAGLSIFMVIGMSGMGAVHSHAQSSHAAKPMASSAQRNAATPAGDIWRGKAVYEAKCGACHSVDSNRVGPLHAGVLGRKAGSVRDFDYSDALRASSVIWNRRTLVQWLTDPESLIPGQRMGYRLDQMQDRADVVQYLSTLK